MLYASLFQSHQDTYSNYWTLFTKLIVTFINEHSEPGFILISFKCFTFITSVNSPDNL